MIRILIVDDHEHIRGMIRALLEAEKGWQVCGEAADGRAGIDQCVLLSRIWSFWISICLFGMVWKRLGRSSYCSLGC